MQNCCVFAQAVHLIQKLIEKAFIAGTVHSFPGPGDQIHIFDHDHSRLQKARELEIMVQ